MVDKVDMIEITMNRASAAVLGGLITIAANVILDTKADNSGLIKEFRRQEILNFISYLQQRLAASGKCGISEAATVRFGEKGEITIVRDITNEEKG